MAEYTDRSEELGECRLPENIKWQGDRNQPNSGCCAAGNSGPEGTKEGMQTSRVVSCSPFSSEIESL